MAISCMENVLVSQTQNSMLAQLEPLIPFSFMLSATPFCALAQNACDEGRLLTHTVRGVRREAEPLVWSRGRSLWGHSLLGAPCRPCEPSAE